MARHLRFLPWVLLGFVVALSCSDEATPPTAPASPSATPTTTSTTPPPPSSCLPLCFEPGSAEGHADPLGARAASQARAGRIKDASQIVVGEDARQKPAVGDFLLANDRLAVYIEDKGLSDGYARFGGEILAIDRVGDDGRPLGLSRYGETLMALSKEMILPDSVTVLSDGSDGKAAVVRVMGKLTPIPFLGSLGALFPRKYGLPAIWDYILEPGSDGLSIRLGLRNDSGEDIDLSKDEMHGFFHSSKSRLVTPEEGYAEPKNQVSWAGFDGGPWSFAWRLPGQKLNYAIELSGFQYFLGGGKSIKAGETRFFDYVELIAGGPQLDGLREAIRRVDKEAPWTEVKGTVTEQGGAAVAGAYVHLLGDDGAYLSRTVTDAQGAFVIHTPPQGGGKLVPSRAGYVTPEPVAITGASAALSFAPTGQISVQVTEDGTGAPLPVRVQVIPTALPDAPPDTWGDPRPANNRLYQEFVMNGQTTLPVPPGEHRVIVSRGYEWEMIDQKVTVTAGQTATVQGTLRHSVDTTGVMCADFHIHSFHSADSSDPVEYKVRGALADGLDIPVSSEHEWVVDFQPVIEKLGLTRWAHGIPSEELTTFTWGHFGVLPLRPRDERLNRGAFDWIGKEPPAFFEEVHNQEDKPLLIINHPSQGNSFGAYFEAASFKRDTATGSAKLWSDRFEAVEVFNDSDFEANRDASVGDWFALLNRGKKVWAVGSSDSHGLRTSPIGYPRSCIQFGHDDPEKLSPDVVRDGVAAGTFTISGGLYLTVQGPAQQGPGQTITAGDAEVTLTVDVQAPSWLSAQTLEVIVNGETTSTVDLVPLDGPAGPAKHFRNEVKVKRDASKTVNWVIVHAKGGGDLGPLHPGRKPFAVSNPIFLD